MFYRLIWSLLGEGLFKYNAKQQNKGFENYSLEYRFTDSNGLKYYGFSSEIDVPVDRYIALQKYAKWLNSNITKDSLGVILDKMNSLIEDGVVQKKTGQKMNVVKLAALINELKERHEMILEDQIIYNIICVQLIREDEEIGVFNKTIHQEKVDQCIKEIEDGNDFFLQSLEYSRLIDYSTMSPSEWKAFLAKSSQIHQKVKEKIASL